jgi:hypothetical protein
MTGLTIAPPDPQAAAVASDLLSRHLPADWVRTWVDAEIADAMEALQALAVTS